MNREVHVHFCGNVAVRFCWVTRLGVTLTENTIMRIILVFLILNIFISCGHEKSISGDGINIETKIVRSFDTLITYPDSNLYKAFNLDISIINNSSLPASFWMMTCSWNDNFIVNNEYIKLAGQSCDSNFPTIEHLKPNEKLNLKSSVIKLNFTRYQTIEATKLGFVYIDFIYCKNLDDYFNIIGDKSKQNKIIWSNPVNLNEGNKN